MLYNRAILLVILIVITCTMLILYKKKTNETFAICPNPDSEFSNKRFLKTENCYSETGPSCVDVVRNIHGNLEVDGLSEQLVEQTIGMFMNNTYSNKDAHDNNQKYTTNECVIPQTELKTLRIEDCKLDDLQFQNGNPKDDQVVWDFNEGCIITETQLKNNIANIVRSIKNAYDEPKQQVVSELTNGINQNNISTQQNWNEYNSNKQQTAQEKKMRQEALDSSYTMEERTKAEKAIELHNNQVTGINNMESAKKQGLTAFMIDKIIGLRYEIYHGYFDNKLDHFTKYIPYELGFITQVNDFSGVRGYSNGVHTQQVSINITGIFRPDVSGKWRFAIVANDVAYVWIDSPSTDYSSMSINSAFLSSAGGDKWVEVSKDLEGVDRDSNSKGYSIRIVQGNNEGHGALRVYMMRPNKNHWEILNGDQMLFSKMRKGLACKVVRGYFWDDTNWLRVVQPMCAVAIDELYHLPKEFWNPNFGITGKGKYNDFKRIMYTNYDKGNRTGRNDMTHPIAFSSYPSSYEWQRSMNIYGWFLPKSTGLYTFYLASDDASYLWIGNYALYWYPWTSYINNGGLHGTSLRKAEYYVSSYYVNKPIPIRIVQGDYGGGNSLVFAYRKPGEIDVIYDLLADFRH